MKSQPFSALCLLRFSMILLERIIWGKDTMKLISTFFSSMALNVKMSRACYNMFCHLKEEEELSRRDEKQNLANQIITWSYHPIFSFVAKEDNLKKKTTINI